MLSFGMSTISISPPRFLRSFRRWAVAGALIAALVAVPVLLPMVVRGESYGLSSDRPAPAFHLKAVDGATVSLADFEGKFLFLMFGYLNCEKVCHNQAWVFQEIDMLYPQAEELAFAYVAIDPARDRPAQVAAYFDRRGEHFVSLHGDSQRELQAIAGAYRSYHALRGSTEHAAYRVDHNGAFFLIGPDGNLRYRYAPDQNVAHLIIDDLRAIRNEYEVM